MPISTADRLAIHELLALHGHLSDAGAFDHFDEIFTDDIAYDLTAYGAGVVIGRDALRDMALQLGDGNPLGHHVTNIVVSPVTSDTVQALSKGLAVETAGTTASVIYEDTVLRTESGWRISRRRVVPRRKPLQP
ncbi:nuclear transport factor 2 family protein [Nocardia niigatensis]|uniref:nuclear transport factor 2 family protein n=1 Tax=Nocardia niigatensis TaxID=209249 RepID=UPI0002F0DA67|nr:nuclear transport factor 2 family protein [Nocardia niigatensis]